MARRKGTQFFVGDRPFYVNGFNTYWLMILAADPSTRGKVSEVFRQASSVGLTVCRTWAFNDGGWRALQISPSVYDEHVFQALDFVADEARKYGIRLILTLTNNWDGYGGKAQYVRWAKSAGLNVTVDDDFFTHPTIKGYFKSHVETVLTRVNTISGIAYKDDPTIFAWELMNEPQCPSDPSGAKLQAWIEEMAYFVKSVDPRHMLGIGSEGFYGQSTPERRLHVNPNAYSGQVGADFIANHRALGIDFASVHIYPDEWLPGSTPEAHLEFVATWMQNHIDDAEKVLEMPVVFGEYGISTKVRLESSEQAATAPVAFRDTFISAVYNVILQSTRAGGGGGGCLLWQLFPEGTEYMDDGYAVVLPRAPATAKIISTQSWRLRTVNSRCSWTCHWYCRRPPSLSALEDDEL